MESFQFVRYSTVLTSGPKQRRTKQILEKNEEIPLVLRNYFLIVFFHEIENLPF